MVLLGCESGVLEIQRQLLEFIHVLDLKRNVISLEQLVFVHSEVDLATFFQDASITSAEAAALVVFRQVLID